MKGECMKQLLSKAILGVITAVSVTTFAGENSVSFNPGFKVSDDGSTFAPLLGFEYERNIIPFTSVYGKYGSASFSFTDDTAGSITTSFSNYSFGVRYNVLFFYVGAGYESNSMTFENTLIGNATGSMSGLTFEIGKKLGLGPLFVGFSYGIQLANVEIEYDSDILEADYYDIPFSEGSQTLSRFEASMGFSF